MPEKTRYENRKDLSALTTYRQGHATYEVECSLFGLTRSAFPGLLRRSAVRQFESKHCQACYSGCKRCCSKNGNSTIQIWRLKPIWTCHRRLPYRHLQDLSEVERFPAGLLLD